MMSLTSSSRFRNLQSYIIHCTSLVSFFGVYWSIYHQNNTSSSSTSFPGFSPIRPYEERTWERGRLEFHHSLVNELYFLSRGQNLTKQYFAVVYYFQVKATILDRNVKKNGRCRVNKFSGSHSYFSTGLVPLGSYMYWTSKSPSALVPRSLRIFVTMIMSSVMSLTGRASMISCSVRGSCNQNKINQLSTRLSFVEQLSLLEKRGDRTWSEKF